MNIEQLETKITELQSEHSMHIAAAAAIEAKIENTKRIFRFSEEFEILSHLIRCMNATKPGLLARPRKSTVPAFSIGSENIDDDKVLLLWHNNGKYVLDWYKKEYFTLPPV